MVECDRLFLCKSEVVKVVYTIFVVISSTFLFSEMIFRFLFLLNVHFVTIILKITLCPYSETFQTLKRVNLEKKIECFVTCQTIFKTKL